jgi:hypothetical protein
MRCSHVTVPSTFRKNDESPRWKAEHCSLSALNSSATLNNNGTPSAVRKMESIPEQVWKRFHAQNLLMSLARMSSFRLVLARYRSFSIYTCSRKKKSVDAERLPPS